MNFGSADSLRVVIAGGGTGGHVFPALAIKQAILRKVAVATVVFVGTRHGIEASVMQREGETLATLWISGLSRRHLLRNLLLPVKLTVSLVQSLHLLTTFKPQVVVGTGGYVMGPVLWVAQRLGIPTIIQEQNSLPGMTTRRLARRATAICLGFQDAQTHLRNPRIVVTGNPLRQSPGPAQDDPERRQWHLDPARKTILVFGGSAGARSINDVVAAALSELLNEFNLIWQTGRMGLPVSTDSSVVADATARRRIITLPFIEDMAGAYAASDLAVCRAGAMTLAELTAAGLPAILVPYPFAADDHQSANARSVVARGGALMIKDSALSPERIKSAITDILNTEGKLQEMSEAMRSLARLDAADRIADIVLEVAGRR